MKWNLFATEKEIQFLGVPLYAVEVFAVSEDSALKSSCSLHCHYLITEKIRDGNSSAVCCLYQNSLVSNCESGVQHFDPVCRR